MWDLDAINHMLEQFHSFEIHVSTAQECNNLIRELNSMGFIGGMYMEASTNYVPYPFFRIHRGSFGGNNEWRNVHKPRFEYSEFVAKFKLEFCEEENIACMDSVI